MYQPSAEQAEKDRKAAYEAGVPHGEFSRLIMSVAVAHEHQNALPLQHTTAPGHLILTVHVTVSVQSLESAGYLPPGNKYRDLPTIHLQVVSDLVSSRLARAGIVRESAPDNTSAGTACAAVDYSSHTDLICIVAKYAPHILALRVQGKPISKHILASNPVLCVLYTVLCTQVPSHCLANNPQL